MKLRDPRCLLASATPSFPPTRCGVPALLVQTAENRVMDRQASHVSDVSETKVEWQWRKACKRYRLILECLEAGDLEFVVWLVAGGNMGLAASRIFGNIPMQVSMECIY